MKVKFEFVDGSSETYNTKDVDIIIPSKVSVRLNKEKVDWEDAFEYWLDIAVEKGGVIEVPPSKISSLIRKVKIVPWSLKKIILIDEE